MDLHLPNSQILLLLAACLAIVLAIRLAVALFALAHTPRYFRRLVAVSRNGRSDVTPYQEVARPVALALGYEFIDTYRAYRGSGRHLRTDVWRTRDDDTLATVSVSRFFWWHYPRMMFVSVMEDGTRLTTSDNFEEGDPRGVQGEVVQPGASFRMLHTIHQRRVREHRSRVERIGWSSPVSVIEDLERQRVQELAGAGLARFHGETENAWSYTWRGACEVYYLSRPRQVRASKASRTTQFEEAAK